MFLIFGCKLDVAFKFYTATNIAYGGKCRAAVAIIPAEELSNEIIKIAESWYT